MSARKAWRAFWGAEMHAEARIPSEVKFANVIAAVEAMESKPLPGYIPVSALEQIGDGDAELGLGAGVFLGLVASDGVILPPLQEMITEPSSRARVIGDIATNKYRGALIRAQKTPVNQDGSKGDMIGCTPKQFAAAACLGTRAPEREGAVQFALDAIEYARLPVKIEEPEPEPTPTPTG